jgi:hypothetical protein
VWSDAFDDELEANKVVTEYQSISALEESLVNKDVELIFEEMIENEIAEIDSTLEKINKELNSIQQQVKSADSVSLVEKQIDNKVETKIEDSVEKKVETVVATEAFVSGQYSQVESVDDINRITEETPTAAGIPVEQVLPKVTAELTEVQVSNEILRLAEAPDYELGASEFGMWQLVKRDDAGYQEICSLSSSTIQVELENYSTQVWLRVVGTDLLVNATTNIDVNKPRVGVKFDDGSLQSFTKSYFNTGAVWSGDLGNELKNNKQLYINIGGNELGMRTQEVAINLKDLKAAYSEYQQCNSGIQIGSL